MPKFYPSRELLADPSVAGLAPYYDIDGKTLSSEIGYSYDEVTNVLSVPGLTVGGNIILGGEIASPLEIRGVANTGGILTLSTSDVDVLDGNVLGQIDFQAPLEADGQDAILVGASIWAEAEGTFGTGSNATSLVLATGASETATGKVWLLANGDLGVGLAAPVVKIHALDVVNAITPMLMLQNNTATTGAGPAIDFVASSSSGAVGGRMAFIRGGAGAFGDLSFSVLESGGSLTERMRLQHDGKLGIGTSLPLAQVDIRGAAGTAGTLLLATDEPTVVDGDILGRIDFQAPLETGADAILVAASIYAEADGDFTVSANPTELVFATAESEVAAEKMRLTSDGKLGLGTPTPSAPIHMKGGALVAGWIMENTTHCTCSILGGAGGEKAINFANGGTVLWKIGTDNAPAGEQEDFIIKNVNNAAAQFRLEADDLYLNVTDVHVNQFIVHAGDLDTFIDMITNRMTIDTGGEEMIDCDSASAQSAVTINRGQVDVDFVVHGVDNPIFKTVGSTNQQFIINPDSVANVDFLVKADLATIIETDGLGAGKLGLWGASPVAAITGWSAANCGTVRVIDCSQQATTNLYDILGTLIADLLTTGVINA